MLKLDRHFAFLGGFGITSQNCCTYILFTLTATDEIETTAKIVDFAKLTTHELAVDVGRMTAFECRWASSWWTICKTSTCSESSRRAVNIA